MIDMTGLIAAIDAGDKDVLPVLADFLEDLVDPRSAGLRLILQHGYYPDGPWEQTDPVRHLSFGPRIWYWHRLRNYYPGTHDLVPPTVFGRLQDGGLLTEITRWYGSAGVAYLDLARALMT